MFDDPESADVGTASVTMRDHIESFRQIEYRGDHLSVAVRERTMSDHLVLCIHGLGCSKDSFNELFSVPELQQYSICAVDLPGHGESDIPADFTYGMNEYAEVMHRLVDQLSPARVSVIAHSMGGAVGVLLAINGVDIERFVSVEGNLVAEDCGFASRGIADQTFEEFSEHGYAKLLRTLESSDRRDLQVWASWLRKANPKALHDGARSLVEWSDSGRLLDAFNALHRKTYMHGDEDNKGFLLPHLQEVPVTSISQAGHFCMIDNPEEFQAAVVKGLTSPHLGGC